MAKTCTHQSCNSPVWGKGYCRNHQNLRPDKKLRAFKPRAKIKPMSKKLSKERSEYRRLREEFLKRPENLFCAVYPHLPSSEVHHSRGRGKYLNDVSTWLAVSREGHNWIEANPALSRERGFSMSRLQLVKPLNEE